MDQGTLQVGDTITLIAAEVEDQDNACSGCFLENEDCPHNYNGSICYNYEDKINIILKRV
jgi:hypothetical protein